MTYIHTYFHQSPQVHPEVPQLPPGSLALSSTAVAAAGRRWSAKFAGLRVVGTAGNLELRWMRNPAPPKGWLKPYKSWDLSTGAGFRNHPQYEANIFDT